MVMQKKSLINIAPFAVSGEGNVNPSLLSIDRSMGIHLQLYNFNFQCISGINATSDKGQRAHQGLTW